jgi:hypothetical protein
MMLDVMMVLLGCWPRGLRVVKRVTTVLVILNLADGARVFIGTGVRNRNSQANCVDCNKQRPQLWQGKKYYTNALMCGTKSAV